MAKKMTKGMKKIHEVGKKLQSLKKKGIRKITVFYTRKVNGKTVPNYKTIGLTAALVAAAGAGAYLLKKHKKHGHVLHKKKKR